MNSEEKSDNSTEEDSNIIKTPAELLHAIENGVIEIDAIAINYEIKRLIYENDVECSDFEQLFYRLIDIFTGDQIVEITQVLFPGFCNWIEVIVTEGKLSAFDFSEFYDFHNNIISQMDEDTCNPCQSNSELVLELFYEEVLHRYEKQDHTVSERIKLASLLQSHDKLAEMLVTYDKKYIDTDDYSDDVEEYLDMVDPDRILDPVLKNSILDMIRDSEW